LNRHRRNVHADQSTILTENSGAAEDSSVDPVIETSSEVCIHMVKATKVTPRSVTCMISFILTWKLTIS
jgi:hypothetical protein